MSAIFRRGLTWWVDLRRYGQGRRSLETRDKAEAKVRARRAERAAWEGRIAEPEDRGGPTLTVAVERAWNDHKRWKNAKSPATIRIHINAFLYHFGAETRLGSIGQPEVRSWVSHMEEHKLSGSTINARLTVLRVLRNTYDMDPLKMPATEAPGRRKRVVSGNELAALCAGFDADMRSLVIFLRETGCRLGEALVACGENIDRDLPAVVLPDSKNGDPRTIPLTRRALAVLAGRPAHGRLWPSLTGSIVAKRWAAQKARIGVTGPDFVVHALRHTKATELVKRHGIAVAKAWLGHRSLATTDGYTHLDVRGIINLEERHTSATTVPQEDAGPLSIASASR